MVEARNAWSQGWFTKYKNDPVCRNQVDFYSIMFHEEISKEKVGEKVGEKLTENQVKIITLMKKNPVISAKDIAPQIEISLRKTESNIKKLRELGYIRRIGHARGGHWEVISKEQK